MFWEEKIDNLKKEFTQTDFHSPFTDWPKILKKIEAKFIIKPNSIYHFTNWENNLKNKTYIKTTLHTTTHEEIKRLETDKNYWVVVVNGNYPTAKHLVFDCKVNSLRALLSFISADFYIIDKRYNWLVLFKTDYEKGEVKLFKSGDSQTPFE